MSCAVGVWWVFQAGSGFFFGNFPVELGLIGFVLGLNWVCFGFDLVCFGFELALIGFELGLFGFVFAASEEMNIFVILCYK